MALETLFILFAHSTFVKENGSKQHAGVKILSNLGRIHYQPVGPQSDTANTKTGQLRRICTCTNMEYTGNKDWH